MATLQAGMRVVSTSGHGFVEVISARGGRQSPRQILRKSYVGPCLADGCLVGRPGRVGVFGLDVLLFGPFGVLGFDRLDSEVGLDALAGEQLAGEAVREHQ